MLFGPRVRNSIRMLLLGVLRGHFVPRVCCGELRHSECSSLFIASTTCDLSSSDNYANYDVITAARVFTFRIVMPSPCWIFLL